MLLISLLHSGEHYLWGCLGSLRSKNSIFLRLRYISWSRCIQVPPLWPSFYLLIWPEDFVTLGEDFVNWNAWLILCLVPGSLLYCKMTKKPQQEQTTPTKIPRTRRSARSIEVSLWSTVLLVDSKEWRLQIVYRSSNCLNRPRPKFTVNFEESSGTDMSDELFSLWWIYIFSILLLRRNMQTIPFVFI